MTRETELEQQLAEAQAEIEQLKAHQCLPVCVFHQGEQLAAQQTANATLELEVMRLREIAADIQGYFSKSSKIYCLCESALGNPQGLHALRDFATKVERATIERCAVEASIKAAGQMQFQVDAKRKEVSLAEAEADRKRAEAQGEADAIRIKTAAIAAAGGDDYVRLQAIAKWDGKLPSTTGGAIPFINVR